MWIEFFVAVAFLALLLYLPGWGVLSCAPMRPTLRPALAPVVTVPVLALTTMAYSALGISCVWWNVMLPVSIAGGVAALLALRACRNRGPVGRHGAGKAASRGASEDRSSWLVLLLYVAVSLLATGLVFVKTLDGPNSFTQAFDSYAHLKMSRQFVDTGVWTTGSFFSGYPCVFYIVVALVVSALGCEVTMATNAAVTVLFGLVFGTGMYAFLGHIFKGDRRLLVCGALASVAVAAPWYMLTGVLFPNILGFVLAPGVMCLFMRLVDGLPHHTVWNAVFFVLGLLGMALAHPNAVFMCILFLTPFCASRIWHATEGLGGQWHRWARTALRVALVVVWFVVVALVWVFVANLPSFSSVVNFARDGTMTLGEAVTDVLTLAFNPSQGIQPGVMLMFYVGAIYVLATKRDLWLLGSFLMTIPVYIYCVVFPSTDPIRPMISGFWYHDWGRVAAVIGFAVIPLVTLGLAKTWGAIRRLAARSVTTAGMERLAVVCAALFFALAFYPNTELNDGTEVTTGFGPLYERLTSLSSMADDGGNLSEAEINFIEKAFEQIPEGAVVLNLPYDGSVFSYGATGHELAYRLIFYRPSDLGVIQSDLKDVSTNPEVQKAVEEMGAKYLLLLDVDDIDENGQFLGDMRRVWWDGTECDWSGIYEIDDSTPGFKVLLSEGDMRLYEIELPDAA